VSLTLALCRHARCLLAAAGIAAVPAIVAAAGVEAEPALDLATLLPAGLRRSSAHSVEEAAVDGRFYRFRMDSDFGLYTVPTLAMLRIRVAEVQTLSQSVGELQGATAAAAEQRTDAQWSVRSDNAIDIFSRPVETAQDFAGQVADDFNETFGNAPRGAGGTARWRAAMPSDPTMAMHKRNVASQWGLDVYSSNDQVQDFLNHAAQARSGGRISAGSPSFISSAPRPLNVADPAIDAEVGNLLKNTGVEQLAAQNSALLRDMQVPAELVVAFIDHAIYTPRHQTRITRYLRALDGTVNRAAFLEAALPAPDEGVALAFEELALMLAHYHRHVAPIGKLHGAREGLQGITGANRIVLFLPVDIVWWSEATGNMFGGLAQRSRSAGFSGWEVVVAGDTTVAAATALSELDFIVRANYVRDTAPGH
jgi:hypothetical protein